MKASTLLLSAALALGCAASASAQVITTFETLSSWEGSRNSLLTNGAVSQTFQLPTGSPVVYQMSWRFTAALNPVTASSTLDAYLTEWNTTTNKPTGAALWSGLGLSLPAYGSGNYDLVITPNFLTNPLNTYALVLRGVNMASNVRVANVDEVDAFSLGGSFRNPGGSTSFATMSSVTFDVQGFDWAFSQFSISDSLVPIPETGTVAVVFAGVLVAGLGVRRRLLTKRDAAAQVSVAA